MEKTLALEIVEYVRESILESIANAPNPDDHDPWDEGEDGCGWLENEVSYAMDLLEKVSTFKTPAWLSKCVTVSDFQLCLTILPLPHLKFIHQLVVDFKGTSNEIIFPVRRGTAQEILQAICIAKNRLNGISCHHCGKDDVKMRACSGCEKAHYCDATCQKADWKKHKKECKKGM
jgi:hypothetical protein